MRIERDGSRVTAFPSGRIDANTAQQFAADMEAALQGAEDFTLDLSDLAYISSSGLRAFMLAIKTMGRQGAMRIVNASEDVYAILELTGFTGACDVYSKTTNEI